MIKLVARFAEFHAAAAALLMVSCKSHSHCVKNPSPLFVRCTTFSREDVCVFFFLPTDVRTPKLNRIGRP